MSESAPKSDCGFGLADWAPVTAEYPELTGRVAVLTGAARGMGAYFLVELVRRGVQVYAVDLDRSALDARIELVESELAAGDVRELGKIVGAQLDVQDQNATTVVAQAAAETFGRLDYWINNAGIFLRAPATDITAKQLARTFGVNVNGVLFGSQAAAQVMVPQGSGVIINTGSVAANRVRVNHADYCASKAAVEHWTRCLAVELGPRGIRVNGIGPGDIDTDMLQSLRDDPAALEKVLAGVPLGRIGAPPEVLAVLLFLMSDGARYITGHVISVDGGSRLVR